MSLAGRPVYPVELLTAGKGRILYNLALNMTSKLNLPPIEYLVSTLISF